MMQTFLQRAFTQRGHPQMLRAAQRSFANVAPHSRMPRQMDYYQILGITSDATPEQIKDSYRDAAKRHHPDVVGASAPDA